MRVFIPWGNYGGDTRLNTSDLRRDPIASNVVLPLSFYFPPTETRVWAEAMPTYQVQNLASKVLLGSKNTNLILEEVHN